MAVALDTWIGRPAVEVAVRKLFHNVLAEMLLEIENKMLKTETVGHTPCILNIRKRTAGPALLLSLGYILVGKQLQGNTHNIEASVPQKHGSYRAVHTSAHTDHYLFHLHDRSF